jgi:expansin (peptidoglycan-binding protein)
MKVKVIQDYNDSVLKKLVTKNTELEVTDARGKVLINSKVAIAIPTTTKKGGRKKADE